MNKQAYPRLLDALNEVRGQWRRQKLLEGSLLALAGVLAVLVSLVIVDNWLWQSGPAGRVVLAAVLWGGLALALLGLVVKRLLEDRRDDFFAALVEQKHPELHDQLINALQLGRGDQRGMSPELIGAIIHDADKATVDMDMKDSVDHRPALRAALWALGAILLLGGYAAAMPSRFGNGLARVLLPLGDIPPYTLTQIVESSIQPGDTSISEGVPIAFEVRVQGVIPTRVKLQRRSTKGSLPESVMEADVQQPDLFRFEIKQAAESFDYHIVAGDARSPSFHVEVIKAPRIESLTLTYQRPAYTESKERQVQSPSGKIADLAGTRVQFELKTSKAIQEGFLKTDAGEEIKLTVGDDDKTLTTSFVLWSARARPTPEIQGRLLPAPTTYQIHLRDTVGYLSKDPLWRSIELVQDQAPAVTILSAADRQNVKLDQVLPLAVEASDDYGLARVRLLCKLNNEETVYEFASFDHAGQLQQRTSDKFSWDLGRTRLTIAGKDRPLKVGDHVEYWAEALDRNNITGPGRGESRRFSVSIVNPAEVVANLEVNAKDFARILRDLLKRQRTNRTQTAEAAAFDTLVKAQAGIRTDTRKLARDMESEGLPLATMVQGLDALATGLMAEALKLLESGQGATREALATDFRNQSLPVQDKIIAELEAMLARLERNEQARQALRKLEQKDKTTHKALTTLLAQMIKDLENLLKDQTELAGKFEKMPKKSAEEVKDETLKALKDLDDLKKRTEKWAKGSILEMAKMPTGFIDDFNLRKDANRIYEEIEKAAAKPKPSELPVALEDLGAALATKMKEDLEMWLPDAADATKWVLEEPLDKKGLKVPEMPLPKALEDLIGELLQKADEVDEEADDKTSAWGDNLDQAGWGVADGPISTFSAKGKTGNDQPNNMELTGRSGDGRRGKSTGQMVGDTSKALPGRKTPARLGNEKYEPGQVKQESKEDPNGATGGGKKAGAGRKGLQGGSPPDISKDMGRLSAKQAGLREKAEQVARKLDAIGINTRRLTESIELMRSVEKDLADQRYDDAARKRRDALLKLKGSFSDLDNSTAARIKRATDLPPQLRQELLQAAEEGYPTGYEGLLKNYYKALSTAETPRK